MILDDIKEHREIELLCEWIGDELGIKISKEGDLIVARYIENNEIAFLSRNIKVMHKALLTLFNKEEDTSAKTKER